MAVKSETRNKIRHFKKVLNPIRTIIYFCHCIIILLAYLRSSRYYQPIFGLGNNHSRRESFERWNVMVKYLPPKGFSFLDIGCSNGYFTFLASQKGATAIGIESREKIFELANSIKSVKNMNRVTFLNMAITPDNVESLFTCDVLCLLSLFHHWVRKWGFETADKMFSTLCKKTKMIYFETGQPNEVTAWVTKLKFMEPDIEGWIKNYLASKGFSTVECIGNFPTDRGDSRFLFFGSKEK